MYSDRYHPQVKKDLKHLDPSLREIIKTQHIPKLLADPIQGELLVGDLNSIRSYHFTFTGQHYRIAYLIEESSSTLLF